jgi:ubiquinone biosynthesis protein UbiJ
MKLDPAAFPSEVANRVLGREAWARDKLAAHAGRTFAVRVGPAGPVFQIGADGTLAPATAGTPPDVLLSISPLHVPALLADPRLWNEHVAETGDAALGGTLKELAQTLPWFVEAAFARALGPIAGQRVADAGRHLLAFPAHAATRLADSAGRYARDEAGLVVRHDELRHMTEQTALLAQRVDALEARVAALTASP